MSLSLFSAKKYLIGMIHLRPLPGSPRFRGDFAAVVAAAVEDARALVSGGVHGIMMENFGDTPFFPGQIPQHVVAHMTAVACAVRREAKVPLGINVLRNDGLAALAVAHAAGAEFIRVNILTGARVTDQGIIQGVAHDLLRLRKDLGASHIKIMADVDVKHSAPLSARPLADEVEDLIDRGMADGVIVSGTHTGKKTDPSKVAAVRKAAGKIPVLIGSGITAENLAEFVEHADGFIVGTGLKVAGDVAAKIDAERVRALVRILGG